MKALHLLTILGSLAGAITLAEAFTADSAPKQGAVAAIAAAMAVVPYCFARAVEIMSDSTGRELRKLNEAFATHTKLLASIANSTAPHDQWGEKEAHESTSIAHAHPDTDASQPNTEG